MGGQGVWLEDEQAGVRLGGGTRGKQRRTSLLDWLGGVPQGHPAQPPPKFRLLGDGVTLGLVAGIFLNISDLESSGFPILSECFISR